MLNLKKRWQTEELASSQKILKTLLILSLILTTCATIILWLDKIHYGSNYHGLSPFWGMGIITFFAILYRLNRKFTTLSSSLFIASYFLLNSYFAYLWGIELPMVIIFYLLLVVMTAILRGARGGWIMAGATSVILFTGAILESQKILTPNLYWRLNPANLGDAIPEIIIIIIIATICTLYARQIRQSLKRAWRSEDLLRQERDNLEETVAARTEELQKAQLEKMTHLYRLAEFGRLAAGIFHDLINPLTAINANLRQIEKTESGPAPIPSANLQRALRATKRMEDFVVTLKKQLKAESRVTAFSIEEEIKQVIILLNYPLTKNGLACDFKTTGAFWLTGDPIKFSQIIMNLTANAIDSYSNKNGPHKAIEIRIKKHEQNILISVQDYGTGITDENQAKIFEPFFSTKPDKGLGIGLSAAKNIIEKDYGGQINFQSQIGSGTKFTISLPCKHESSKTH